MKTLVMMMVLSSSAALAVSFDSSGSSYPDMVVDYVSWCDRNSVISQDQRGDLYVRANCTEQGLQCRATQLYRNNRSIVTASCTPK